MKEIRIDQGNQICLGTFRIKQKLHRDLLPTTSVRIWHLRGNTSLPGPTIVATEGIVSNVRWENHITDKRHMLAVDYTVMRAKSKHGGVPIVTHLHGAECDSTSDGYPDLWHIARGDHGPTFTTKNYTYENSQRPSMLWYYDHTFFDPGWEFPWD